jgi:beta-lactamase regulating signal transducer with metallopeptidase domain
MTGWLIETMAATTLLMLLVLAVRRPIAARFGAQAAYLLWLLPALRMILPRMPEVPQPIRTLPLHLDLSALSDATVAPANEPARLVTETAAVPWIGIALALWLGGAILYFGWQLLRHHSFMTSSVADAGLTVGRERIAIHRNSAVGGPIAAGLFRRHVLLPDDFMRRYTPVERRLALLHELAHHRRGDLFANIAALLILSLHWFNPIAHWAYRAFRVDQEQACDATVLSRRPACAPAYGTTLVKAALGHRPAAACALGASTELKGRLQMIAVFTRQRSWSRLGLGLAAVLVVAGLTLTASGGMAATSQIITTPMIAPVVTAEIVVPPTPPRPMPTKAAKAVTAPPPPAAPAAPSAPEAPAAPAAPAAPRAPSAAQAADLTRTAAEARAAAEAARADWSAANIDATVRQALWQARQELTRQCGKAHLAAGAWSEAEPIDRLAARCVDVRAINAEIARSLRAAAIEVRAREEMPEVIRRRVIDSLERSAKQAEHDRLS